MLFTTEECILVWTNIFADFYHGRHEPEVVISHHLRHLAGPCKELFYSFRAR